MKPLNNHNLTGSFFCCCCCCWNCGWCNVICCFCLFSEFCLILLNLFIFSPFDLPLPPFSNIVLECLFAPLYWFKYCVECTMRLFFLELLMLFNGVTFRDVVQESGSEWVPLCIKRPFSLWRLGDCSCTERKSRKKY